MLKKTLLTSGVGMLVAIVGAVAEPTELDKKTVSSKAYVDTMIETKQLKIPAAGQPGVDAGETVMTYTAAGNGVIGERGLYTDISSYDESSDGGKLITASALNATFTNLSTTDTTKLVCADDPTCSLWVIVDQLAYGNNGNGATIDLSLLINTNGIGRCTINSSTGAGCIRPITNRGDWGVVFPYNDGTIQVDGISVCSSVNNSSYEQSSVQSDYESNAGRDWGYCYCKLTSPVGSPWVFVYWSDEFCSTGCPATCSGRFQDNAEFRSYFLGNGA